MARGVKKKLTETTELPIIHKDEEIGNIPFFVLEKDAYGISSDPYSYSLVRRKNTSKTIKDEAGNESHVETFYTWEAFKWAGTFEEIVDCYIRYRTKELDGKLVKVTDIDKLNDNRNKVYEIIKKAFSSRGSNKQVFEFSDILKRYDEVNKTIIDLESKKEELEKNINEINELIKSQKKDLASVSKIVKKK